MPHALFLSPHLDDVAFSCAGTLLRLLHLNWTITLVTIFTATLQQPRGFALRCQTDKGIGEEIDYMALRRHEDDAFARVVGLSDWRHWTFAEAPHRGYESASELFAGIKDGDEVWRPVSEELCATVEAERPDAVFAPQGLGNHVDHLQTILAVKELGDLTAMTWWYRDTPYVIRAPQAPVSRLLPSGLHPRSVPLREMDLERKIIACQTYASQIDFQFGGGDALGRKLRAFHQMEARTLKSESNERYAECFLACPKLPSLI